MNIKKFSEKIREISKEFERVKIMHLCGTHEDTITKFNIRSLLPKNIQLISGPGCPVCITPDTDIQMIFHLLSKEDIILTTFGDMARVPYSGKTLLTFKSKGYDVRIVYSIFDSLEIAKNSEKPVVHFAIGFETTMPSTALAIIDGIDNFYVFSSHRFFIPAIYYLCENIEVDAFINPGHVSTIIGVRPYEDILKRFKMPQVIAGFEAEDVLLAIYMLLKSMSEGKKEILNEYKRAVKYEGNLNAQKVMKEVFRSEDWEWRGLGVVRGSGGALKKKYEEIDARKFFEDAFKDFEAKSDDKKKLCRCGEVLKGLATPKDCPLFMRACNPRNPIGPCMVSFEGTCNIWAKNYS